MDRRAGWSSSYKRSRQHLLGFIEAASASIARQNR
jgi:hypothetical protein